MKEENMTEKYDPSEKFGVQTDAETLKQAALFAAKVKKDKKDQEDKSSKSQSE
jgi:hypothetical protein